jgi:CCR4-NOT transcription complex subunit 11
MTSSKSKKTSTSSGTNTTGTETLTAAALVIDSAVSTYSSSEQHRRSQSQNSWRDMRPKDVSFDIDWSEYWKMIASNEIISESDDAYLQGHDLIDVYQECAKEWLDQVHSNSSDHSKNNLFSIAWACYTILSRKDDDGPQFLFKSTVANTMVNNLNSAVNSAIDESSVGDVEQSIEEIHKNQKTNGVDSNIWKGRLGCLALLRQICSLTVPILIERPDPQISQSPFFPLLLQATLIASSKRQQPSPTLDATTSVQEGNTVINLFLESLLPQVLGNDLYEQFQEEIALMTKIGTTVNSEGGTTTATPSFAAISIEVQNKVNESIQRYTSNYVDAKYVNPLLLFPSASTPSKLSADEKEIDVSIGLENDRTAADSIVQKQKKDADFQYLINSYNTRWSDLDSEGSDEMKFLDPIDLLKPHSSISVPFARPLPPPMLPFIGYDEDEDALSNEEENELLQYLHSELIWLTPCNLRLLLIPDDENNDDEEILNIKYKQVVEILQSQAFIKPLAPNSNRLVIEMLSNGHSSTAIVSSSSMQHPNEESNHGTSDISSTSTNIDFANFPNRMLFNNEPAEDDYYDEDDSIYNPINIALRIIRECGLTPLNLPKLVEHNPLIAYECLVYILLYYNNNQNEDLKNEYLSSLVSMDMSLHCMEVVNRLATYSIHNTSNNSKAVGAISNSNAANVGGLNPRSTSTVGNNTKPTQYSTPQTGAASTDIGVSSSLLHPEYIHLFIVSCMESCENLQLQDRHTQNRLVRLVCIFIQSLVRNNIVNVNDIYFEIQSFCVEFSRIREASSLYKSLQQRTHVATNQINQQQEGL